MSSYGALWVARIKMMRPGNALLSGLAVMVGMALAAQQTTEWPEAFLSLAFGRQWVPLLLPPLAAFAITGFGNVLNDIQDVELDRTAHPERPLAKGSIALPAAKIWMVWLAAIGLVAAVYVSVPLAIFAAINTGLLLAYETKLKPQGLAGNLMVGLLAGSAFLFGAFAYANAPQIPHANPDVSPLVGGALRTAFDAAGPLALMAALATLARELLKDCQDASADAPHRKTLATRSTKRAWQVAFGAILVAVAYALWMLRTAYWPLASTTILIAACVVMLGATWLGRWQFRAGQKGLKVGMLVAMLAYLSPPIVI